MKHRKHRGNQIHTEPLGPFYGEFLVSPVPLELDLDFCSHKCSYCFANLSKPGRRIHWPSLFNLLKDYQNRDTLTARLLQQGYPVLISNKSDPFAASNAEAAYATICQMTELSIPIALQTRGGKYAKDVASWLPPSCWYISICQLDDTLRARLEPGAPSIDSRFELIEAATSHGHVATVGMNPLVKEWLPEPEKLLDRAKAAGAVGVWSEPLHLNYKQRNEMSDREKAAVTLPIIERGMRRNKSEDVEHLQRALAYAESIGLEPFSGGLPLWTGYHDAFIEVYDDLFPTQQEFTNGLIAYNDTPRLVTFTEWSDWFLKRLPEGDFPLNSYIGSIHLEHQWPRPRTFRDVLEIIWLDPHNKKSPAYSGWFAFAKDGDGNAIIADDGYPAMAFVPETTREWCVTMEAA